MLLFERFVEEGNEKADELAKDGVMMDEGEMAQVIAGTVQQEREEVNAALQYAVSFRCLVDEWQECEEPNPKPKEKSTFVNTKKHRTEW